ncbi:hypothetical protein [Natronoarchaeum rubrum]|uniref:hypothetical protein n=1 Tax=Natronoarchaeum rubrum TaxID=755311 RepID=UPI002111F378|nr:hypothetical protein [Natronoarchaeum rubrum]HMB49760.1 hypothetical protein [Natronoarchaeum rubrum]
MDRDQLLELVPHYVALVVLLLLALTAVRVLVGDVGLWVELLIAFVIAVGYRPLVARLGYAPSAWER